MESYVCLGARNAVFDNLYVKNLIYLIDIIYVKILLQKNIL